MGYESRATPRSQYQHGAEASALVGQSVSDWSRAAQAAPTHSPAHLAGQRMIVVNLGEIKVSQRPQEVLVAHGLGSCVAIAAVDPVVKAAGLAHVVSSQ